MVKTVVITGGAGRIAYSLIPLVLNGALFEGEEIKLCLLDMEICADKLAGIKMEIEDCNFVYLSQITTTTIVEDAFAGADVIIILGGHPRLPGMVRKDLIGINAEGMRTQAEAINKFSNSNVKVLVVANPCNTNTLVGIHFAPNIPARNFSCLTRLDEERLKGMVMARIAQKLEVSLHPRDIRHLTIWGNHSMTQVPDTLSAGEVNVNGSWLSISSVLNNEEDLYWVKTVLTPAVQNRGASVLKTLGGSSAMSAASAIVKHLCDWICCSKPSTSSCSFGLISDGTRYGVPAGLVFSFPCHRTEANTPLSVVPGLSLSEETTSAIEASITELLEEREMAENVLGISLGPQGGVSVTPGSSGEASV